MDFQLSYVSWLQWANPRWNVTEKPQILRFNLFECAVMAVEKTSDNSWMHCIFGRTKENTFIVYRYNRIITQRTHHHSITTITAIRCINVHFTIIRRTPLIPRTFTGENACNFQSSSMIWKKQSDEPKTNETNTPTPKGADRKTEWKWKYSRM